MNKPYLIEEYADNGAFSHWKLIDDEGNTLWEEKDEPHASQLHPSPTPDVEDVLADIISIRNKLYEDLPTGEMNAFELLQTIKWHINELDNYCTTLSNYKSQPSTPVQDGWVKIEDGLPSKAGKYIVYGRYAADCPMNVFQSNFYKKDKSFRTDIKTKGVTHWQPLPSPPVNKQD